MTIRILTVLPEVNKAKPESSSIEVEGANAEVHTNTKEQNEYNSTSNKPKLQRCKQLTHAQAKPTVTKSSTPSMRARSIGRPTRSGSIGRPSSQATSRISQATDLLAGFHGTVKYATQIGARVTKIATAMKGQSKGGMGDMGDNNYVHVAVECDGYADIDVGGMETGSVETLQPTEPFDDEAFIQQPIKHTKKTFNQPYKETVQTHDQPTNTQTYRHQSPVTSASASAT